MSYGFSGKYVNDSLMNGFPKAPTSNIISYYFPSIPIDSDAQAFITAAGITDLTQQNAVNQLVIDLKGYAIWAKLKAIYPFVGGTATTHKFNLKNPLDTNGAFRLTFSGGWTHSVTGALPNGTNGYANTFFSINNFNSSSDISAGVYLRTNSIITGYDFGQGVGLQVDRGVMILTRYSTNRLHYSALGNSITTFLTNTNSAGFYAVTRGNSTQQNIHVRISQTINDTQSKTILNNYPAQSIFLGAINNETTNLPAFFSNREQAFMFIGDFLTEAEFNNFTISVQAFNTSLSRQI